MPINFEFGLGVLWGCSELRFSVSLFLNRGTFAFRPWVALGWRGLNWEACLSETPFSPCFLLGQLSYQWLCSIWESSLGPGAKAVKAAHPWRLLKHLITDDALLWTYKALTSLKYTMCCYAFPFPSTAMCSFPTLSIQNWHFAGLPGQPKHWTVTSSSPIFPLQEQQFNFTSSDNSFLSL